MAGVGQWPFGGGGFYSHLEQSKCFRFCVRYFVEYFLNGVVDNVRGVSIQLVKDGWAGCCWLFSGISGEAEWNFKLGLSVVRFLRRMWFIATIKCLKRKSSCEKLPILKLSIFFYFVPTQNHPRPEKLYPKCMYQMLT